MYALATTLMVLAIVAVVLRVHARRMMKASLASDFFASATAHGSLGGHTPIDPNGDPIIDHRLTVLEQVSACVCGST